MVEELLAWLGVDPRRFVMIIAPTLVTIGVLVPGIFIGYVPAMFATVEPIGIGTTHGSSAGLELSAQVDPIIRVSDGNLDDLCLMPRVSILPLVHNVLSARFYSHSPVSLGQISFVGTGTAADGLALPSASIGNATDERGQRGPLTVQTDGGGRVQFHDLATDAYSLSLDHGFSISSLRVGLSMGHLDCAAVTGRVR